ncbi:uncharacterized protein LOC111829414 [Capsella rubella]|uniref:uncharacterized protein LOC111829414 n=1 Tax=Capsella rubella TaxID=81985 RepID=UPI000CD4EE20|nr:uncharacterized protein LOC111829414 [Capsella rubella]
MSELVETSNKPKESVPSSIQCLLLTQTNYTVWAIRMKVALQVHKVWETVKPGSTDVDKNNLARALLFHSTPKSMILQVGNLDTSKVVWDSIKTRNLGADRVKEARLQTLMAEFDRLKMKETDMIDDFVGKLSEISTKSVTLGETIDEVKIVKKFLKSLPRKKYIHITGALEQVLDLKTTTSEDIVRKLKTYEERICDEEDLQDGSNKLMYCNSDTQPQEFNQHGGRGRGWSRGRGRGRGNHAWFCKIDPMVTGKVRFGDDSKIDIKGKGSITFIAKGGERKVLADVYYIPDLKSKIISLGQATDSGCDIRMKEDYLTIHDRAGNLLVQASRSRNRLYKVRLEVDNMKCLLATNNSTLWHARLGHISPETIKTMVIKELVVGIANVSKDKETCASCLLGKPARRVFPKATSYCASQELELIHGDLCGPISPLTAANKSEA